MCLLSTSTCFLEIIQLRFSVTCCLRNLYAQPSAAMTMQDLQIARYHEELEPHLSTSTVSRVYGNSNNAMVIDWDNGVDSATA